MPQIFTDLFVANVLRTFIEECQHMFETLKQYPAWNIVATLTLYLLLYLVIISLIVFVLRPALRKYKPADLAVFNKISHLRTPANDRIMLLLTFFGKHNFLIPANLLLIFCFIIFKSKQHYGLTVLLVSLSSVILMFVFKWLFRRKRPADFLLFEAAGKSFPSGHAMMSVCFYGLMLHIIR
ncbi:MAG TPA: phosphatase PAP2 family protein, partial [Ferruginibacter sp.]|nr:phosphatase PAP2 family protein [Ferruginibacter sp.]